MTGTTFSGASPASDGPLVLDQSLVDGGFPPATLVPALRGQIAF